MRERIPREMPKFEFRCRQTLAQYDECLRRLTPFLVWDPMTATSSTAGWRSKALSTSIDEIFSPPLMMTSLKRSRIST